MLNKNQLCTAGALKKKAHKHSTEIMCHEAQAGMLLGECRYKMCTTILNQTTATIIYKDKETDQVHHVTNTNKVNIQHMRQEHKVYNMNASRPRNGKK